MLFQIIHLLLFLLLIILAMLILCGISLFFSFQYFKMIKYSFQFEFPSNMTTTTTIFRMFQAHQFKTVIVNHVDRTRKNRNSGNFQKSNKR